MNKDPKKCCEDCSSRGSNERGICDCPCHAPTIQESPTQGGGEWDTEPYISIEGVLFDVAEDQMTPLQAQKAINRHVRDAMAAQAMAWQNICNNVRKEEAAHTRAEIAEKVRELMDANDDGMWTGMETAETILAVLKELDKTT